jgi:hypothetical protein
MTVTVAAQGVLEAFERLSELERELVFRALVRRALDPEYEGLNDDELLTAGLYLLHDRSPTAE